MVKTSEQLQELAEKMNQAWQKAQACKRPTHQVRNCPSDLDAETQALRAYQGARQTYLDAVREAQL
jgi:hypothetical protein